GPLEKLREGTRDLVAQRFDSRVDVQSGDEFQDLAASFNTMAGQLGKQFQALKIIQEIDHAILASLDRDGIVDAVLDRLPHLLPSHICGVALTNDKRFITGASLTTVTGKESPQRKIFGTEFFPADIRQLRSEPQYFQAVTGDDIPNFLRPLNSQGKLVIGVFP